MEPSARHLSTKQLVDEFKKSGEFDRLRRQLLAHFASSDEVRPLMSRVEEIVREKLAGDERLEHKTREAVHAEVVEDMERYPIVERAVSQLDIHKDEHLIMSIEQYAQNIVHGKGNDTTQLWEAKPSRRKRDDEEEDNDGSSDYTEYEDPDDGDMVNLTNAKKVTSVDLQTPGQGAQSIAVSGDAKSKDPSSSQQN